MQRNAADACIYTRHSKGIILLVALYVDDLLIACNSENVLRSVKKSLGNRFKMKDLGPSRTILGMDIHREHANGQLTLCQSRYAAKVISRFGQENAKPLTSPMELNVDWYEKCEPVDIPYREALGALMYLAVGTRPIIAFAVFTLAKFAECHG